jgi:hypothetical protein
MAEPDDQLPGVWHAGEQAMQARLGLAEKMAEHGARVIRSFMPDQHRSFFAQLPFLLVGSVDGSGAPWASMLTGRPGFVDSPDPTHLQITATAMPGDPLTGALKVGERLGILGIELATRRRNRMNGEIINVSDDAVVVAVEQSFGNCPKYIQARDPMVNLAPAEINAEDFTGLTDEAAMLVASSDTFFVASYLGGTDGRPLGIDISHRGGLPGFIRIDANSVFTVPDFPGNRFFNTLGNLLVNPRAGLLFINFETGDLLQLTGRAEVVLDPAEITGHAGAERFWRFAPQHGRWLRRAFPQRVRFRDFSPANLAVGNWGQSAPAAVSK